MFLKSTRVSWKGPFICTICIYIHVAIGQSEYFAFFMVAGESAMVTTMRMRHGSTGEDWHKAWKCQRGWIVTDRSCWAYAMVPWVCHGLGQSLVTRVASSITNCLFFTWGRQAGVRDPPGERERERERESIRVLEAPGTYGALFYNHNYNVKCWSNIDGRETT